mmetsp:Transcript_7060/g.10113  ORF Transcript_7060/g.10113 Transcript_7060/m.10113 type:complete len:527 (-) Transcript_7060:109-1689(-)
MPTRTNPDEPNENDSNYHSVPETGIAGGVGLETAKHVEIQLSAKGPVFANAQKGVLIAACYMSVAAMLGSFFRIVVAQFFGEECKRPGTVGWLSASSPLCVTVDGVISEVGGIVFADFPANMLGCFIMGLMLAGDKLVLPLDVPIAWLSPDHFFQRWDVIHLAIRTGFCGSLTTLSSWNADMVVMMYGAGQTHSQIARAIIGYIIGMETALGSFAFGSKVAVWIHRYVNPALAKEADALIQRKEEGVFINKKLPDFERRFLPDLDMEIEDHDQDALSNLERWRLSTIDARRVGNVNLAILTEIENCILIDRQLPSPELQEIAQSNGWNIAALQDWIRYKYADEPLKIGFELENEGFTLKRAAIILLVVYSLLFLGLAMVNGDHSYAITYRTMIYAAIFAPPGAILRWQLGKLNGKVLSGDWSWVPAGTLCANIFGSVISITAIAIELRITEVDNYSVTSFWIVGSLRALKIGFAGCLTTVSTFVSEVSAFMKCPLLPYRAYIYIMLTLVTCNIIAAILYGLIVYVF